MIWNKQIVRGKHAIQLKLLELSGQILVYNRIQWNIVKKQTNTYLYIYIYVRNVVRMYIYMYNNTKKELGENGYSRCGAKKVAFSQRP